jgi:hypothetical protein
LLQKCNALPRSTTALPGELEDITGREDVRTLARWPSELQRNRQHHQIDPAPRRVFFGGVDLD